MEASAVLLVLVGACGEASSPSRDGALPDATPMAPELGSGGADGPLPISDGYSDPAQPPVEAGAAEALPSDAGTRPDAIVDREDLGPMPDAGIDTTDMGTSSDRATDGRGVDVTILDLGADRESGAGRDAPIPAGCVGEDLFVDVTDQRSPSGPRRLLYPCGSTLPMAYALLKGRTLEVAICASENPDWSGARLGLLLLPTGQDSGYFDFDGLSWSPAGGSTSMTDACGGPGDNPLTISRFDAGGGILEGNFDHVAVGYSCEGIDATLSGHFRVCYVPAN
jgi:hypothetical protein